MEKQSLTESQGKRAPRNQAQYQREWRRKNKDKVAAQKRRYLSRASPEKREEIRMRNAVYLKTYSQRPEKKEKHLKRLAEYAKANPEKVALAKKKYRDANKEKANAYYKLNADRIKARIRAKSQTPEARAKRNAEMVARKKTDINFKILKTLRSRMGSVIRFQGTRKACKTVELLGCSIEFARGWLESQFKQGMTWKNHGHHGWHIDHIRPCASFDLTNPDQQKECFHYTNLQPLWKLENLAKAAKYEFTSPTSAQ